MYWLLMNLYRLYKISCVAALRDFCKTFPFAQFLRQTRIVILEILNVFLPAPWNAKHLTLGWLKFLSSLNFNKIRYFSKVPLLLGILAVILGNSIVREALLKPPGLRPTKDPSIVIPTDQHYPNQPPNLPKYRNAFGRPAQGWASETVETRRFSSDQSALIYYRVSDLEQSHAMKTSNMSKTLRIWPVGTIIILESYKGNVNLPNRAKLIAIDAMKKMNDPKGPSNAFFPVNWSYARFSPEGKPSITSQKVKECHQCHSIAFHITGDLVFTLFPWEIP
jgi:hypothetical protein